MRETADGGSCSCHRRTNIHELGSLFVALLVYTWLLSQHTVVFAVMHLRAFHPVHPGTPCFEHSSGWFIFHLSTASGNFFSPLFTNLIFTYPALICKVIMTPRPFSKSFRASSAAFRHRSARSPTSIVLVDYELY